ncbi:MAG: hypothetical protein RLZZ385_506 [Pseudomonadota bacterium]
MTDEFVTLTLTDICQAAELPETLFLQLVEHGIVQPHGQTREEWMFDTTMVGVARRAGRLHRDLELEWSAVVLIVDLLEQRDRLLRENRLLSQRLQRFMLD